MGTLYLLQTDQNILNVIATKHFDYKNIQIIRDQSFRSPYAANGLKDYLDNQQFNTSYLDLDPNDIEALKVFATRLSPKDLFVIPNSRFSYTLNMTQLFTDKCQLAFIEEDGDIYYQSEGLFAPLSKDKVQLEVSDYIENIGGYIKHSSDILFNEPCAQALFKLIINNLKTYRHMLKPSPIKMNYDTGIVHVNTASFSNQEKELMKQLTNTMIEHHICASKEKRTHQSLVFYNHEYKDFIGKIGTWLEMATYKALCQVKDVDSPMSSVFFYWNRKSHKISNEIDVMGTYDNRLVLISCKDTGNNLEKALYELFTHGEQLGFDKSIKILVTTSKIYPQLKQRGKELGIHLVQYDKGLRSLSVNLRHCLIQSK